MAIDGVLGGGSNCGRHELAVVGADPDRDVAGSRRPDDGERAAVEGRALRAAERLLRARVRRTERGQLAGAADLNGQQPVAVAGEVAFVVLEGDGYVGEVGVVGADRLAVSGRGEAQRTV